MFSIKTIARSRRNYRNMHGFCAVSVAALTMFLMGPLTGCVQSNPGASFLSPPKPQAAETSAASPQAPRSAQLEDAERRIGPLKVKGKNFTVVLHVKRVRAAGAPSSESEETVTRIQIRDDAGRDHYDQSIPFQLDETHFADTTEVEAQMIEGSQGGGLLLSYGILPSTPLGGNSWQVFGIFDDNLVPFSKPIALEGSLLNAESNEGVVKTSTEPNLDGDVLRFRVWTSNVFVIIPVKVDWLQAKVRPALSCQKMTSRGLQPVCTLKAESDRIPAADAPTFVRLLPDYFEPDASAQRVVVKKTSKVELLEAAAVMEWDEEKEIVALGVGEDLWLKVRIDGKEGWIHTQEDFYAIGFPQAG